MYDQQAFEKLKKFLETHPASFLAAKAITSRVEVGVVINQHNFCTYFKDTEGHPKFEMRNPKDPDFIFYLSPEAIESLVSGAHETIAEVGINMTKNYLAGTVKVKFAGSIINIFTRGYLGVIKEGGSEYMRFLSLYGMGNFTKIIEFVSKLKKQ